MAQIGSTVAIFHFPVTKTKYFLVISVYLINEHFKIRGSTVEPKSHISNNEIMKITPNTQGHFIDHH